MTPLELKAALNVLRAEVTALRDRVGSLEARPVVCTDVDRASQPLDVITVEKKSERKMCPHCGVKPNHFFHVKACRGAGK